MNKVLRESRKLIAVGFVIGFAVISALGIVGKAQGWL